MFKHRSRLRNLCGVQDHTMPVRIHFIRNGVDIARGVMDQSEDSKFQRLKSQGIAKIVDQEISFFVRVYRQSYNGKQPSQKEVIDYFDAWDSAVRYYDTTRQQL